MKCWIYAVGFVVLFSGCMEDEKDYIDGKGEDLASSIVSLCPSYRFHVGCEPVHIYGWENGTKDVFCNMSDMESFVKVGKNNSNNPGDTPRVGYTDHDD